MEIIGFKVSKILYPTSASEVNQILMSFNALWNWTSATTVDQRHGPLNVLADQLSDDKNCKHSVVLERDLIRQLHYHSSFTNKQGKQYI
ncbi:unnamed protein product [Brugia timori]|uniref:Integrase catalytic domain-containing protein n=1 Tax=Brugia timori TaxID=42155 RepID=A0A0R3Q9Q1_9BILA|nr:unnamed protein product [Brugia timori]